MRSPILMTLTLAGLMGLALTAPAQDSRPSEAEKPAVPPIPTPEFGSEDHQKSFQEALQHLDNGSHKAASKILKKMKKQVAKGAERQAVERGLKEAKGLKEIEGIDKLTTKGKIRQALAKLDKLMPDYVGTNAGAAMAERHNEAFEQVYLRVADFEDEKAAAAGGDQPQGGGDRRRGGGSTGYGQNTSIVKGDVKTGEVRQGSKALRWRTTANTSNVEFGNVEGVCGEYRWLCFSMKCEDPKKRPNVVVLFDAEEGPIRGGRGGFGGRGGAGAVFRREGFSMQMGTEAKWQDLRLDLRKFSQKGDITWDDVISLKIIHMPGVEGRLVLDNIRLERE